MQKYFNGTGISLSVLLVNIHLNLNDSEYVILLLLGPTLQYCHKIADFFCIIITFFNKLYIGIIISRSSACSLWLIIKQLTKIKVAINPTNTLVTYNENSTDKTIQNSDNVIDKTIQNNNKEPFKNKKNTNKNLANTKTLSTTDNFTSTCFEHPKNEKEKSPNGKNTSEANEKKKQKKKKEDHYKEKNT